jgi:mRNA-degrading endonuclease toxin of MazEF toxin-antitoxin module
MRQQLLVDGEPVDTLVEIFPYFETHREANERITILRLHDLVPKLAHPVGDRVYPFQVLVPANESGLEHDSKVQAEQVRSVSIERVRSTPGSVPDPLMLEVDEALRLHLSL